MRTMDPNVLIGLIQGYQGGNMPTTGVQGIPDQALPRMQQRFDAFGPDRMNTLLTGLQSFAPSWEQGQRWGLHDVLGGGEGMRDWHRPGLSWNRAGGGTGGVGMGSSPGTDMTTPGFGGSTGGMPQMGTGMGMPGAGISGSSSTSMGGMGRRGGK